MSLSNPTGWGAFSVVGTGTLSSTRETAGGCWLTILFFPLTAGGPERSGGVWAHRMPPAQKKPITRTTPGRRRMAAPYKLRLALSSALNYSLLARVSTEAEAAGRIFDAFPRAILAYSLAGNSSMTRE